MSILNTHDMEMIESANKLMKKLYQEGNIMLPHQSEPNPARSILR